MTRKNDPRDNGWMWARAEEPEIPRSGDVVIREPKEGCSRVFYEAVVRQYLAVQGTSPRTARIHPSTVIALAPTDGVRPVWWPVSELRRHNALVRIILSDDPPLLPD